MLWTGIREILKATVDYLYTKDIQLISESDGRIESQKSEEMVFKEVNDYFSDEDGFEIISKKNDRSFGDFYIKTNDIIYPVNIKIIKDNKGSGGYNVGSWKIFNYYLYGGGQINSINLVKKMMIDKPTKIAKDYFYLIYYKDSKIKPIFYTLTDLDECSVITNPSNGIQVKNLVTWKKRNEEEKVEFLFDLIKDIAYKLGKLDKILSKEKDKRFREEVDGSFANENYRYFEEENGD